MGTSYNAIYESAIGRFSDYDLIPLSDEEREAILLGHLKRACADFGNICLYDLKDRDDAAGEFEADLDDECIDILGLGVAYHWCSSKVLNSELFRNVLNTKDFSFFSPGSLLNNLRLLRGQLYDEYKARIVAYSYDHGEIASLKV